MDIAGITLKNLVMPVSGTFGSGQEYSGFADLNLNMIANMGKGKHISMETLTKICERQ